MYRRKIPEPKFTVVGRTGEPTASILPPYPPAKPIETPTPAERIKRANRELEPPPWLDDTPPPDERDYAWLPDDGIR